MTKQVLILGATGQIAQHAINALLKNSDAELLLFARHPQHLKNIDESREKVIKGDTLKTDELDAAVSQADVVYANLRNPEIKQQAENIVKAMDKYGVKQLIWISSIGIYDEVPGKFGEWNKNILGSYLTTYRAAADQVTTSNLDYTIIRPAWLTNKDEVDYEMTKGANTPFKGTEVSRLSVASYVNDLVENPSKDIQANVGLNKPNTDGDKPAWY